MLNNLIFSFFVAKQDNKNNLNLSFITNKIQNNKRCK